VQSVFYKTSEPQEIVSLVTGIQSEWRVAARGEGLTESKAEGLHSVEQEKGICVVLCSRSVAGLLLWDTDYMSTELSVLSDY
jgi:hypothetical protein